MSQQGFGHPRDIDGKSGTFKGSLVPLEWLQAVRTAPIPITVSGSSNVTFNVVASTTNPVAIWNGNDLIWIKETHSHTMSNDSTNSVIGTAGALSSAQTPGAIGVKYYYIGQDSDGAISVHPSTVAPSKVEGPFNTGVWGHPGIARDRNWRYVGWSFMSATTPAFDYLEKDGYTYNISNHAYAGVDTQPGQITMAVVPAHAGVRIGGFVTGAASVQAVELGSATDPTLTNAVIGKWIAHTSGTSAGAQGGGNQGYNDMSVDSNGNVTAHIGSTATTVNVHVTKVEDVV